MRLRLQAQYSLTMAALAVATVLVVAAAMLLPLRNTMDQASHTSAEAMDRVLLEQLHDRGAMLARFLADNLANPLYKYDMETIRDVLGAAAERADVIYLYVFDNDGRIVHDGDSEIPTFGQPFHDAVGRRAAAAKELLIQTTDGAIDVALPIFLADRRLGGVRVGLSLEGVRREIDATRALLDRVNSEGVKQALGMVGILTLFFLLLGSLAAVGLARHLSRPILQLVRAAERVGRGEYRPNIAIRRGDEVGELATALKEMGENLERTTISRSYLDDIITSMQDTLVVACRAGRIQRVNRALCELSGYREEELTDAPIQAIFGQLEGCVLSRGASFAGGATVAVETALRTRDGVEIPVSLSVSGMDGGQPDGGFVYVAQDLRERKRQEEERRQLRRQMEHAQRLESLGVLAGGIAHDFNNILTAVLGNTSLARAKVGADSEAEESLERIEEASRRAADLCQQMLAYSGKGKFVVKPVDLSQVVREMAKLLEVSIAKNVVLRYDLEPGLPPVEGDASQLQQVGMNLVINASEAIGDRSGEVSIITGLLSSDDGDLAGYQFEGERPSGPYVYLAVTDDGCGMDHEAQEKIFDPFFTSKFMGRGLGMSAVLGIVRGHNGAIRIDSTPGEGTAVRVLFPAVEGGVAQPPDEQAQEVGLSSAGIVLVVEDEEMVREVAVRMFGILGVPTLTAANGDQGVELFRQQREKISAVLLDMTMPGMGGDEAYEAIRKIDPQVKIILTSGYNEQEAIRRFPTNGLAGFIQKPYTVAALKQTLAKVVGGGYHA